MSVTMLLIGIPNMLLKSMRSRESLSTEIPMSKIATICVKLQIFRKFELTVSNTRDERIRGDLVNRSRIEPVRHC